MLKALPESPHPWCERGTRPTNAIAAGELLRRSSYSKYLHYESPLPPTHTAAEPTLSGTAWHSALNATACNGCRGTCAALTDAVAPVARCDCGPQSWGARCDQCIRKARPRRRCSHNDSAPWTCVRPVADAACDRLAPDAATQCFGGCSRRGSCEAGFCRCRPPFWGIDCRMGGPARSVGADSHSDEAPPRCTASPCIYVRRRAMIESRTPQRPRVRPGRPQPEPGAGRGAPRCTSCPHA